MTIASLAERGYEQYEVSNFAKPGFRSRHNRNYWNHSNYIGFGPSAHSFWTVKGSDEAPLRWWNVASIVGYLEKLGQGALPVSGSERLSQEQLLEEEIFLGLRSEGIDIAGFSKRFGKDLLTGQFSRLNDLVVSDMAVVENGKFRLTPKGYMVCDEICASLRV
jgi:oxygen-independent coproporphyrinogen-3 oxidase